MGIAKEAIRATGSNGKALGDHSITNTFLLRKGISPHLLHGFIKFDQKPIKKNIYMILLSKY